MLNSSGERTSSTVQESELVDSISFTLCKIWGQFYSTREKKNVLEGSIFPQIRLPLGLWLPNRERLHHKTPRSPSPLNLISCLFLYHKRDSEGVLTAL